MPDYIRRENYFEVTQMLRKIFNCLALFLLQTHLISAAAETSLKEVFNALIEHRIKEGADKLSTVDDHSAEKIAVRLFAAFSMSSWEEVIQLYPQLPEPYRSLDGYRGMVILSYIYLDKITQAENLLNQLLQSTEEPKTEKLPEYFRDFKEKTLDKFNRYYIAALFNKIVKRSFKGPGVPQPDQAPLCRNADRNGGHLPAAGKICGSFAAFG